MTAPVRPPVVSATPRLAARARTERRSRRMRWLRRSALVLAVLVPLAALAWLMLLSSLLALRQVTVEGIGRLSSAQVQNALQVVPGTPLARIDTDAAAGRVAALAPVATVRLQRVWPHRLRVLVTERVPAAAVAQADGTVRLVDASGAAFASVPAVPAGLPRLDVAGPGPSASDPATVAALDVLKSLPQDLRQQVRTLRAPTPDTVTLQLRGARTVIWGSPGGAERKLPVVTALLRRAGRTIDVSSPGVAVVH